MLPGRTGASPQNMKATAVSIGAKESTVVVVKALHACTDPGDWPVLAKAPQHAFYQWLRRVHCSALDTWGWKSEGQEFVRLARVHVSKINALMAASGAGFCVDALRDAKVGSYHIDWQEYARDCLSRALPAPNSGTRGSGRQVQVGHTRAVMSKVRMFEQTPLS